MLNLLLFIFLIISNNSGCVKYVTLEVGANNSQHFLTESSVVGGRSSTYYIPRGGVVTRAVTYGTQSIWEPIYDGEVLGYLRISKGENPVILVSSCVGRRKILKYYNLIEELWVLFREFDSMKNKQPSEKGLLEKTDSEKVGESFDNSALDAENKEVTTTPEELKMDVSSLFSIMGEVGNTQSEDPKSDETEINSDKLDTGKSSGLLKSEFTRIDLRESVKQHVEDKSESSDTEESLTFCNTELMIALEELMDTETKMSEGAVGGEADYHQEKSTPCIGLWDIKGVKDLDYNEVLTDLDVLHTFQALTRGEKSKLETSLSSIKEESEQDLIEYEKSITEEVEESVLVGGIFLEVCRCDNCKNKGFRELHFVGHSDEACPDVEKIETFSELAEAPPQYPGPQESEEKSLQVSNNSDKSPPISEVLERMDIDDNIEDVELEDTKNQNSNVFYEFFGEDFDTNKFSACSDSQSTEISVFDSDDSDEGECELMEDQIDALIDQLFPNLRHIVTRTRDSNSQTYHKVKDEDSKSTDSSLLVKAGSLEISSDSEDGENEDPQDSLPMPMDIESGPKPDFTDPCVINSYEKSGSSSEDSNRATVPFPNVIVIEGPLRPVPKPRTVFLPAPGNKLQEAKPVSEINAKDSKFDDAIEITPNDENASEVPQTEDGIQSQTQPEDSLVATANRALGAAPEDSEDCSDMNNQPSKLLGQFLLEDSPDNYPTKRDLESPSAHYHHTLSEYAILKSKEHKNKGLKHLKKLLKDFFKQISQSGFKGGSFKSKKSSSKSNSSKDSNAQETDTKVSDGDNKDPEGATPQITKPSGECGSTTKDLGARPKQYPPKPPRSRLSQIIVEETFVEVEEKDYVGHKDHDHDEEPKKHKKPKLSKEEKELQRMETKMKRQQLELLRKRYKDEKELTRQRTKELKILTRQLHELQNEAMKRHNLGENSIRKVSLAEESDKQVVGGISDDTNQEKATETPEVKDELKDDDEKKSADSCQTGENLQGPSKKKIEDGDEIEVLSQNLDALHVTPEKRKSCTVS